MKRILVEFSKINFSDAYELIDTFGGYVDGDKRAVIFPYSSELVEELENRSIKFTMEVLS